MDINTHHHNFASRTNETSASYNRIVWLLVIGIWSVLSIFMGIQLTLQYSRSGTPIEWYRGIAMEMLYCSLWVVTFPVTRWLARNIRITRTTWASGIIIHIVAGILLSSFTMAMRPVLSWLILGLANDAVTMARIIRALYSFLDFGMMSYLINILISFSFEYFYRVRERDLRMTQLETQLVQSQLHALKMQLQPHFLFNTMNAIAMLARKNDTDSVLQMINRLSALLRRALTEQTAQTIPLREEIELVKLYLEIEQVRFNDKLSVRFDVAPDALDALVPNFLLQPLVENAVRHGIAVSSKGGSILIAAKTERDQLLLTIYDSGPGLNGELSDLTGHGIGLANTIARLQKLYGEQSTFMLSGKNGSGTTATVSIPYRATSPLATTTSVEGLPHRS